LLGNKITDVVGIMTTPALVLHLTGNAEPAIFALSEGGAKALTGRVDKLMGSGSVEKLELADGTTAVVNFGHVATAHVEDLPPHTRVYGHQSNQAGLRSGS
jgi:hypothetical protein